jgi:hypothetical protein
MGNILLFQSAYKREGLWYTFKTGMTYIVTSFVGGLISLYHKSKYERTFEFCGQTYKYFFHHYNTTWSNPRCVEIPIISRIVNECKGQRILEVGNVLQHYVKCNHDVVDLTERYPNVMNCDIAEFKPSKKYDLVVSISTFEHIGCWEDEPNQPEKILKAIENVKKNVLAPEGKFVLTLPLGENEDMERYISNAIIEFDAVCCMQQENTKTNSWKEIKWVEIRNREFGFKSVWCGGKQTVLVGVING